LSQIYGIFATNSKKFKKITSIPKIFCTFTPKKFIKHIIMEDNFSNALLLMGVGLTTVFAVLFLIIGFGNLLIKAVNKYAPEEEKPKLQAADNKAVASIDPAVEQAIDLAVQQLTGGKGRAVKIQRL
jgi:oxaloacetate decarboxylase gamma subunit